MASVPKDLESGIARVVVARMLLAKAFTTESKVEAARFAGEAHHVLGSALQMLQLAVDVLREEGAQ